MESGPLATGLANGDFDLRPLFEMSVQERLIRYRPLCDNPPISVERPSPKDCPEVGESRLGEDFTMRIHNLYEDANGESHFRDIEVEWAPESPSGKVSKRMPATGIMVREITANFEDTWHPAPRRQYVISLGGSVDITASDGETRHIAAGEIVLVEDTTGKDHITKSSGSTPRYTLFVPID